MTRFYSIFMAVRAMSTGIHHDYLWSPDELKKILGSQEKIYVIIEPSGLFGRLHPAFLGVKVRRIDSLNLGNNIFYEESGNQ